MPRGEYSQIIESQDYSYEIEVARFREPVNETIIIENLGDQPIVNPRITVNGKYDWFGNQGFSKHYIHESLLTGQVPDILYCIPDIQLRADCDAYFKRELQQQWLHRYNDQDFRLLRADGFAGR